MVKKAKPAGVHKNAFSHGAYAQDFVLPWENEQDSSISIEDFATNSNRMGLPRRRWYSVLLAFTGRNGDLRLGPSSPIAVIPMPPLLQRQVRAVGVALGNILNQHHV